VLNNIALIFKDELPLDGENEEYKEVPVQPRHWQPEERFVVKTSIDRTNISLILNLSKYSK